MLTLGGETAHLRRERRWRRSDQLADLVEQVKAILRYVAGDPLRLRRGHHGWEHNHSAQSEEGERHSAKHNEATDVVHAGGIAQAA
jgi:hypothetical protein